MSHREFILNIRQVGPDCSPKFKVENPSGTHYWDENESMWVEEKGTIYGTANEAGFVVQQLMLAHFEHLESSEFIIPLKIRLFGKASMTDLIAWLKKAAELTLDYEGSGNGPKRGTLALLEINWNNLRRSDE